jgi:hypothetical protein
MMIGRFLMRLMTVACVCAVAWVVTSGPFAHAGEFKSDAGVSFHYPDGWVAITQLNLSELPQEVQEHVRSNQIDLSQLHVLVVRVTTGEFAENINLIIAPQQVPVTQTVFDQHKARIPGEYEKVGMSASNLSGAMVAIADHPAMVFTCDAEMPFGGEPLRQRQVLIPGGGKTFVFTCTATQSSYDKYSGTFDQILGSLKVPAPVATGFDWSAVWSKGVLGAIVGGFIGLFVALKKKLEVKKTVEDVEQ